MNLTDRLLENLHSARAGITRWPTQNHGGTLKALTMGEAEKILIAGSSPHSRLSVEDIHHTPPGHPNNNRPTTDTKTRRASLKHRQCTRPISLPEEAAAVAASSDSTALCKWKCHGRRETAAWRLLRSIATTTINTANPPTCGSQGQRIARSAAPP